MAARKSSSSKAPAKATKARRSGTKKRARPAAKKRPAKRAPAKKTSAKRAPTAKKTTAAKKRAPRAAPQDIGAPPETPPQFDLADHGAVVLSVFGAFNSRVLIELPVKSAVLLFAEPLGANSRTKVIEALERDLANMRKLAPAVADSALAATAVALAYELEDPFNSATAKSMCAKALHAAWKELRELAPPDEENDSLDALIAGRDARLGSGQSAT